MTRWASVGAAALGDCLLLRQRDIAILVELRFVLIGFGAHQLSTGQGQS